MPSAMPVLPDELYAARTERARARAAERGYDSLVVYADREHSANLSHLTGFDPRFEEAVLILAVARDEDPLLLVGNECQGLAGAAPLPMRVELLPGPQPARTASRPLAAAGRASSPRRASRAGARVGVVGLEAVRRPELAGGALLPGRRAPRGGRPGRPRGERQRPVRGRRRAGCGPSTRSSSWPPSSGPPARPRRG